MGNTIVSRLTLTSALLTANITISLKKKNSYSPSNSHDNNKNIMIIMIKIIKSTILVRLILLSK